VGSPDGCAVRPTQGGSANAGTQRADLRAEREPESRGWLRERIGVHVSSPRATWRPTLCGRRPAALAEAEGKREGGEVLAGVRRLEGATRAGRRASRAVGRRAGARLPRVSVHAPGLARTTVGCGRGGATRHKGCQRVGRASRGGAARGGYRGEGGCGGRMVDGVWRRGDRTESWGRGAGRWFWVAVRGAWGKAIACTVRSRDLRYTSRGVEVVAERGRHRRPPADLRRMVESTGSPQAPRETEARSRSSHPKNLIAQWEGSIRDPAPLVIPTGGTPERAHSTRCCRRGWPRAGS